MTGFRRSGTALVLPAVLVAACAPVAGDWTGIWAADPAWCAAAGRIGSADPAPIRITRSEIAGLENTCAILSADEGPDGVRLSLSCTGEGMTTAEERLLRLAEPDVLVMSRAEEAPIRFVRCPEPRA